MRSLLGTTAVALVVLTACGSTVQTRGTSAGQDTASLGQPGGVSGSSTGDGATLQASTGTTGPTTSGGGSLLGQSSGAGSSTGGSSGGSPSTAQGPTDPQAPTAGTAQTGGAPIKLGIPYIDAQTANAFLGGLGAGLATGDFKAAISKRITQLNARGGVLSRKIQPYFYKIDPSSSPGQYQQAACSAFTHDVKVQYVADLGLGPTFWQCMAKAGVGVINYSQSLLTAKGLAGYSGFLLPDSLALDRLARIQASHFDAMGYFGNHKTARVGILYYDEPEFAAAEKVLEQSLAARGITVAARQAMHYIASTSDVGQTSSEANGAVLAFRSAGVTHVLAVEQNAFLTGLFGISADSQQYYPRYGYTSQEPLGNVASNVPARSLQGALFFGWQPVNDVADRHAISAAGTRCIASFPEAKKETPNELSTLISACESIDLLEAALTAAGDSQGARSLLAGAARMRGFASDSTFGVSFTSQRTDGVVSVRDGKWDSAKGEFVYTSGLRALP